MSLTVSKRKVRAFFFSDCAAATEQPGRTSLLAAFALSMLSSLRQAKIYCKYISLLLEFPEALAGCDFHHIRKKYDVSSMFETKEPG